MIEFPKPPTHNRFELSCKVLVQDVTYDDFQSKGTSLVTEKMVFLVPRESSQRDLFLTAWLPDTVEEHFEIGLLLGHPVSGPARASIHRKNKDCDEHHIFIMSKGAEEDLKNMNGKVIPVTVLGEIEEQEILNSMKDFDLSLNKNKK